jgi:hypothetical protein
METLLLVGFLKVMNMELLLVKEIIIIMFLLFVE